MQEKENLTDLLYEIGTKELAESRAESATKWLKRAAAHVEEVEPDGGSLDNADMRLNVLHVYVRALLSLEDPSAGLEAHRVLEILHKDYGDKLAVMLLQLEITSRDPKPNADAYMAEMRTLTRIIPLLDSNHKIVMHYVHRLKDISVLHAKKVLRQYIVQRLAPYGNDLWTESAVLTLIWMSTMSSDEATPPHATNLHVDLDQIEQSWNRVLSVEAAHGALVVSYNFMLTSTVLIILHSSCGKKSTAPLRSDHRKGRCFGARSHCTRCSQTPGITTWAKLNESSLLAT